MKIVYNIEKKVLEGSQKPYHQVPVICFRVGNVR